MLLKSYEKNNFFLAEKPVNPQYESWGFFCLTKSLLKNYYINSIYKKSKTRKERIERILILKLYKFHILRP